MAVFGRPPYAAEHLDELARTVLVGVHAG